MAFLQFLFLKLIALYAKLIQPFQHPRHGNGLFGSFLKTWLLKYGGTSQDLVGLINHHNEAFVSY
jgi:hypothetical protein